MGFPHVFTPQWSNHGGESEGQLLCCTEAANVSTHRRVSLVVRSRQTILTLCAAHLDAIVQTPRYPWVEGTIISLLRKSKSKARGGVNCLHPSSSLKRCEFLNQSTEYIPKAAPARSL